jgi:beta-glucosidase
LVWVCHQCSAPQLTSCSQPLYSGTIYGPKPVFINESTFPNKQPLLLLTITNRAVTSDKVGGFCRQWQQLVTAAQTAALESGSPPILFGLLAQHGANYLANATIFPQNIGAGATYNPDLVELSGKITGKDLRSCGLAWAISPAIDLAIEPRWARNYECHSSEPYLGAVMADAIVRGIEDRSNPFFTTGRAQAGTIVKHFIGYSNPDSGGDRQDATNPDWLIERFHLPPFRSAFAAGALAVMYNSGTVNKIPGHSNPALTVNLLRQKLNYTGVAVSDYDDVDKLVGTHKVAPNFRTAVKMAIQAGLDVTMIPQAWADTVLSLVESGEVPASRVEESVRRILNLKTQLGLFEKSGPFEHFADTVGQPSDRAAALQMASESITLLKNQNDTLPIALDLGSRKGSILVTGPCANSIRLQSGGWTILWEGANDDSEFYGHGSTFYKAIKAVAEPEGWQVNYIEGANLNGLSNMPDALRAAQASNYTVVCIGEKPYVEFLDDIQDLYVLVATRGSVPL